MLWLKNCERRDDGSEAARVACELGDRALNDGDLAGAREWFERARALRSGERARAAPAGASRAGRRRPPAPPVATAPEAPVARAAGARGRSRSPRAAARCRAASRSRSGATRRSDLDLGRADRRVPARPRSPTRRRRPGPLRSRHELPRDGSARAGDRVVPDRRAAIRRSGCAPSEMIGRCLLDQGDFDERRRAVARRRSSSSRARPPTPSPDLRYQLGLALEAGGPIPARRSSEFEQVYAASANYPDVASKIRALRKALERD